MQRYIIFVLPGLLGAGCTHVLAPAATTEAPGSSTSVVRATSSPTESPVSDLENSIATFQSRYALKDKSEKLVDNTGNGYDGLYGVRNFRVVLKGTVYRGGANNAYNRHEKRDNSNPLSNEGLQNLCREGFSEAVYLYPTRYKTAPSQVNCRSSNGGGENQLKYLQASPFAKDADARKILNLVHDHLANPASQGPIYLHCWNGWHASGFISALILRQFCGVSAEAAVDYWDRNTDGNNKSRAFDKVRKRIRDFRPDPAFEISESLRKKVCL
jgi:hypothetical protein